VVVGGKNGFKRFAATRVDPGLVKIFFTIIVEEEG